MKEGTPDLSVTFDDWEQEVFPGNTTHFWSLNLSKPHLKTNIVKSCVKLSLGYNWMHVKH
jgi:hypothetical protein